MVTSTNNRLWLIISFIFLLSFIPRAISLGDDMLSGDANHWMRRSLLFANAISSFDISNTFQSSHPGVSRMWISSSSMCIYLVFQLWKEDGLHRITELSSMKYFQLFKEFPDLVLFAKLPNPFIISIFIVTIFLLLRILFNEEIAILAAVLLALDPFYIGLSRLIHTDALMSTFLVTSALSFLVYIKTSKQKFIIFSGVVGGFALLSKSPALFLLPYAAFVLSLNIVYITIRDKRFDLTMLKNACFTFVKYGSLVFITFFIFFPAMWIAPIETMQKTIFYIISRVGGEIIGSNNVAHELGNYFMGESVEDPGWLFYPVVLFFRSTPISIIFTVGCLFFMLKGNISKQTFKYTHFIFFFIIFFIIQMSLSSKKFDRYMLSVLLMFNIVAAIGIMALIELSCSQSASNKAIVNRYLSIFREKNFTNLIYPLIGVVIIIRVVSFFPLNPNYLAYYNPIPGGPSKAPDILFVGIGQGLREAANYLNKKPNAREMVVASWNGSEFAHFFDGKAILLEKYDPTNSMYEGTEEIPSEVDYLILYINQLQRNLVPSVIEKYVNKFEPEFIIEINGIKYAWIYKNISI